MFQMLALIENQRRRSCCLLSVIALLLFLMRKTNTQRLAEQKSDHLRGGTNFKFGNKQQVVVEKMEEESSFSN